MSDAPGLQLGDGLYRCRRCHETARYTEEPDQCSFCGSEEVEKA